MYTQQILFCVPLYLATTLFLSFGAEAIPRILIQTKVSPGAYYHESIPTAVDVITRLGTGELALNDDVADPSVANSDPKWDVTHIDDDKPMEDESYLSQFDAVVFLSTNDVSPPKSTSIFSDAAAQQFAKYVQAGGGVVGIHSATATNFGYPYYGRLIGAFFDYHPELQSVGITALDMDHPSTTRFPDLLTIDEEVYHYLTDPRALPSKTNVLLSNGTAFKDPQASSRKHSDGPPPRPLAWYREGNLLNEPLAPLGNGMDDTGSKITGGPGRMFYTSLGHAVATWSVPAFQGHVAGGISWALKSSRNSSTEVEEQNQSSNSSDTDTETNSAASFTPLSLIVTHCLLSVAFLVMFT